MPTNIEEAVTKALYFTKQLSLWGNTRHAMRLVDEENYESHDQYPTINYLSHPGPGASSGQHKKDAISTDHDMGPSGAL